MKLLKFIKFHFSTFYQNKSAYLIFIILFSITLFSITFSNLYGQEPIQIYLNKERSHVININGYAQFWLRHTEMNPGSMVFDESRSTLTDFSLRRYRLNMIGKASENLRYTLVLGDNNLNYYSYNTPSVRILDAYIDYQVNDFLGIGFGKSGWTGLSRYSAPSASQPLTHDIVFAAVPLVNIYDEILRRWGVYARGEIQNIDYRISLSKPSFSIGTRNIMPRTEQAVFSGIRPSYQLSSYLKYQFKDKESQNSAWMPGTYLGKKEIFNIGVGALYQPNTTWYLSGNDTIPHSLASFAADIFYERPLSEKKVLTWYLAYFNYDFGKNFIRNIGINNPATGVLPSASINGPGNNAPVAGTGNSLYLQAGILSHLYSQSNARIQPYGSIQYGNFQAMDGAVINYGAGINLYLNGQHSKLTIGYESRPIFNQGENITYQSDRKSLWLLQYQINLASKF